MQKMNVSSAVKALRKATGESQQYFATRMRTSIRSLQLHERGRDPEVAALLCYWLEAQRQNNTSARDLFMEAMHEQFRIPSGTFIRLLIEHGGSTGTPFIQPPAEPFSRSMEQIAKDAKRRKKK
jgi:transcriptional regulator with XRE-family HTH domain